MANILPSGTLAPNFSLHVTPDQRLSLSELRGKPVILAFYPADWSPVCGDQMALYNEILPEFQKYGAELVGISVDGVWCHAAFAKDRHLHFPLAADFEPKGEIARSYGAYRSEDGVAERALFVIDRSGGHRLELLFPDCNQSRCRRDPGGFGGFAEIGGVNEQAIYCGQHGRSHARRSCRGMYFG